MIFYHVFQMLWGFAGMVWLVFSNNDLDRIQGLLMLVMSQSFWILAKMEKEK